MDGRVRESPTGRLEAIIQPIFPSSHASTLCLLPDGSLVMAFFSGDEEGGDCARQRPCPRAARTSRTLPRLPAYVGGNASWLLSARSVLSQPPYTSTRLRH